MQQQLTRIGTITPPTYQHAATMLPKPPRQDVCPECHQPIEEFSFGQVADRRDPYHVVYLDCPTCAPPAKQRRMAKRVAALMGDSHIPTYAAVWTFATMPKTISPSAVAQAKRFADGGEAKRGLYLFGDLGVGKTSIAISIIRVAMSRGDAAMFIRSIDLMNRLRAAIAHGSDDGDYLLAVAKSVRWLALDDLATERATEYVIEQFYALIETRRSLGLYTVITSNYSLSELDDRWRPRNKDGAPIPGFHIGQRVIDRIAEYCLGVRVDSPNQRRRQ